MDWDKKYTFENFIVSAPGEDAYRAAKSVAAAASGQPGFLLICGEGPGTGKTHLLRSIEREIISGSSIQCVRYMTAEDFIGELVQVLREKKHKQFLKMYQDVDVLQFLAERGPADVRRLCGALSVILSHADLLGEEADQSLAEHLLEELHCMQ